MRIFISIIKRPLFFVLFYISTTASINAVEVVIHPLVNAGAESGNMSGWDSYVPSEVSAVSGPSSLGNYTINATEGNYWFKGSAPFYTTDSSSYYVLSMRQSIDVSLFNYISSIHFGGDFQACGILYSGNNTEIYNSLTLKFFDANLNSLGNDMIWDRTYHDVNNKYYSETIDRWDNSIPIGTKLIGLEVSVSGGTNGSSFGRTLAGVDNLFMTVTGTSFVPEPSIILSLIMTMGLLLGYKLCKFK
jgi:hypothetical protein